MEKELMDHSAAQLQPGAAAMAGTRRGPGPQSSPCGAFTGQQDWGPHLLSPWSLCNWPHLCTGRTVGTGLLDDGDQHSPSGNGG